MPDSDFWAQVAKDRDPPKKKPSVEDLLRVNSELRDILILADKRIKQHSIGAWRAPGGHRPRGDRTWPARKEPPPDAVPVTLHLSAETYRRARIALHQADDKRRYQRSPLLLDSNLFSEPLPDRVARWRPSGGARR